MDRQFVSCKAGTELFRSYVDKFSGFGHLMECVFRFHIGADGNYDTFNIDSGPVTLTERLFIFSQRT